MSKPRQPVNRDNFPTRVIEALAKRAAFICSHPGCRTSTVGPSTANPEASISTGEAAHITAARPGGPRYDPQLTPAQRSSAENGIHLCARCATLIDKNGGADYPVEVLREWKRIHERWLLAHPNAAAASRGARLRTFLTATEFFRKYLEPGLWFTHAWTLVGREANLDELHDFIASPHTVAILAGRGGSGKTKLIHALAAQFSDRHPGWAVRLAAEGRTLSADSVVDLPPGPCLLVVDDAHRLFGDTHQTGDLATLAQILSERSHLTKLLLVARPQGTESIRSALTRCGIDSSQINTLSELTPPGYDELVELAREALGVKLAHLAPRLAMVTQDCPLVTVVGGRLLADRRVPPELLEQDETFRATVLNRFADERVGKVTPYVDAAHCKAVLRILSAVGPYDEESDTLTEAMAEFLGLDQTDLISIIGHLEDAGLLLRRAKTLRVTPDVLGDHLLFQACLTSQRRPTGYADRVFDRFRSVCLAEVLQSLAELDWRVLRSHGKPTTLLDHAWKALREEFGGASHRQRVNLLSLLQQAAFFLPGRVLELVEYAMWHPAPDQPDTANSWLVSAPEHVLHGLPPLLQLIGLDPEHLPRCLDLLWELGRDDSREANLNPEHPIRVLERIASYDLDRLPSVAGAVVDAVERWLKAPDAHSHLFSPFDVLGPMLAKSGHSDRSEPHQVVMTPFLVSYPGTRAVRQRTLNIAVTCAWSGDYRASLRAVESLGIALHDPQPYFGMEIPEKERIAWLPEQFKILDHLQRIVTDQPDPILLLKVAEILSWHALRAGNSQLRQRAEQIVLSIPSSPRLFLLEALAGRGDIALVRAARTAGADSQDLRTHQRQLTDERTALAVQQFLAQHQDAEDSFNHLESQLTLLRESHWPARPHNPGRDFLDELARTDFDLAVRLCEIGIGSPGRSLTEYCGYLLPAIRERVPDRAVALLQQMITSGSETLLVDASWHYATADWHANARPSDFTNLSSLLTSENLAVKRSTVQTLSHWRDLDPQEGLTLALSVETGSDTLLVDDLLRCFNEPCGIPFPAASDEQLEMLLDRLVPLNELSGPHTEEFLGRCSSRMPAAVVEMLLARIKLTGGKVSSYAPLPLLGFPHVFARDLPVSVVSDQLRHIRDESLSMDDSCVLMLSGLYGYVSRGFSESGQAVLRKWLDSGRSDRIRAVGLLLWEAPRDFIFQHSDFAAAALERSFSAGTDCFDLMVRSLYACTLRGAGMPADIGSRDQIRDVADRLPAGSAGHRFYTAILQEIEVENAQNDQSLEKQAV